MKIHALHTREAGPLGDLDLVFFNDWRKDYERYILLSGPNGTGKSTLLRAIAMIWTAFGEWLQYGTPLKRGEVRTWLRNHASALVLDLGSEAPKLVLAFGNGAFHDWLKDQYPSPEHLYLGEWHDSNKLEPPPAKNTLDLWTLARQRIQLGQLFETDTNPFGNIVYLDAEERRWVSPKRGGVGKILPDKTEKLAWLTAYRATDGWEGQLEQSLLGMKISNPDLFEETRLTMNQFLDEKEILPEVVFGHNRIQVRLKHGQTHLLDDLSSGEHQVLIQLFILNRWLLPGGIILIDEPDLHLHPSIVTRLLVQLERIAQKKDCQLILTSHSPDVWERYSAIGHRISLGGKPL